MNIEKLRNKKEYKEVIKDLKELINCYEPVKRLSINRLQFNVFENTLTITYIGKYYNYTSKPINLTNFNN